MSTCGVVQENGADDEEDEDLFGRDKSIRTDRKANRYRICSVERTRRSMKETKSKGDNDEGECSICIRQDLVSTSLLCYCDCIGSQAQHPNGVEDEREKSERELRVRFVCVCAACFFISLSRYLGK